MSSSVLGEIDDILRDGDIELLRREIDEKIEGLHAINQTKADLYHINTLLSRIEYLEDKQYKVLSDIRSFYEKTSAIWAHISFAIYDVANNVNDPSIHRRLLDISHMVTDFSDSYSRDSMQIENNF